MRMGSFVPGQSQLFFRTAVFICVIALMLWVAALVLLAAIDQSVTYTVCAGSLLQLPPPAVHWPPQGQNLELIDLQHTVTLVAVAISIIGAFSVLHANPQINALRRTGWLLASIAGSFTVAALLWLAVQYHVLHANIDALARCL
jgi:hypothetical protein